MALNIELIRESFNAIRPHAQEVISHFYEELFAKHPEAKPLFVQVDMKKQKMALINSLAHVVDYLHEQDHLVDYLKKLGARHSNYGTQDKHFVWVGEALLSTFAYYFDDQWTPELNSAWTEAVGAIASLMKDGLHSARDAQSKTNTLPTLSSESTLQELAKTLAREMIKKAIEEQLDDTLTEMARKKVKEVLRLTLEQEARSMMSSGPRNVA